MDELRLRGQSLGLLSMLAIQFILGMILDLFVELPKQHAGTTGGFFSRALHGFIWALSSGGGIVLTLHVLVAIGLLLGSIGLIIRSAVLGSKFWLSISIAGALGIFTALTNGLAFIGYSNDVNSFVMAIGFIVTTVAYTTGLAAGDNPFKQTSLRKGHSSKNLASGRYRTSHS